MNVKQELKQGRRFIAGVLAAILSLGLLAVPVQAATITDYNDVDGHWAYNALEWAVDNDVMLGTSSTEMEPNGLLTRAQLATMMDRLYGTYKNADISQYVDMVTGSWYYNYIAQAVNMGTLTGYSPFSMGPDDYVTREQAIVVVARTLCLVAAADEDLSRFPDRDEVGSWAYDDVCKMVEAQFVNGDTLGLLNPDANITRAEMAQILANIFQNIYESGTLTGNFHDTILIRGIVDIHDAVFEGDLIIANGLREEELDLNDVTIKGRLVVWGGSEIRVNGQSQVAGVTTPRNDNTVKVIFDEDATALSQENCAVNYPDSMDPDNEVIFTKKTTKPSNSTSTGSSSSAGSSPSTGGSSGGSSGGPSHTSGGVTQKKPAIDFSFPSYLYVNDSTTVTTTLTNTKSVEWTLTKDGESIPISDFTKDGGSLTFTAEGVYTLRAVAKNGSRKAECEKTVTVLPVIDIAFSLPECGHPDEPIDVDLHLENEKSGTVSWSLTKDGDPYPLPDGFTNKGGSLNLTEPGTYVLTASITDASGKEYTESRTIVILPVIDLQIAVTPGETHVDVAALVTANDAKLPVTWTLFQDGAELEWDSATDSILSDIGGELLLPYAGEYELQASVKDAAGRTFYSNKAPISIEGLVSLVLDLPDHGWTDRAVLAELLGYGDYSVSWHAEKDGEETAYSGTLHDNGGNVQFNEPGQYTLTASVTDRLGREFAVSKTVNIYPVISLAAEAAKSSLHVDENLALILSQENTTDEQEISWFITKDGLPYDGLSMGDLSSIAFTEPGDYTFVAKTIDPAGREYACEPVSVHVIENLEVVVSSDTEATHEDRTAEISLSIANGDAEAIEWTLSCDGEDIFIDGLDEDGGILSFPSKGNYVLTASVTDELGKVFEDSVTIRVYPVINMALDAPENIHIDLLASIGLTGNDLEGKSVEWTVISESGAAVENSLNNDGGDLSFTEAGQHFLTAKVVDELGREFSVSGTILVWNTVQLSFRLPEFSHTDETVIVKMTSENLRQNTVDWSLTVDGEPVHLTDGIQGDLSNDGGTVRFTQVGTNVLTATVTDELGRDFTYEQTIEVYPVITLDMTATMAVHTDEIIDISLDADTSLPVEWKINPSNDPDAMTLYDGSLGGNGGAIQIANAGTYDISASVTDATGREFSANTVSVKVYPVAGLEFTLPSAAWTDSHTPVDLLTTDLSDRAVTWTLFKDGEPVSLTGFMLGDLGDKGGSVRFPHTGTYELTASAADELGREYTYSQTINIYPVITLSVSTNEIGYTDTAEDVELTSENLDTNQVVWTVRRDGVEVAQPFALNLSGGHGFFTEPGLYTFTAAVTDELGRVTTASDSIQVYPVGQAGFYLPAAFHTDSVVQLVTDFRELDDNPLYWTLTRNGEIVQIADYVTGELSADGGQLQFKQTGDYKLKAVFVDGGGRVYSYEQEFKVYPIPDVSWTLPNYAHTDTVFNVPVVSEHVSGVDGTTIKWFIDDTYGLRQNWDTYVAGSLTAEPGDIRIKHAGVFTIGCEVTDATGRVFSFDMMNARRTLSSSDESKPYPYRPSFRFFPKRGVVGRGMAEEIAFNGSGNKNSSFSQILLYFFNGLHIIRHQNIQLFHLFPFWRCR